MFTILRIIQNYENRSDIFREGKTFSKADEEEKIEIDQGSATRLEIENSFDVKSWNEFLNDIAHRVADNFVNNSIEV